MSSPATTLDQIAPAFAGRLLRPDEPGYDEARRVHNGLIEKRPSLIAKCSGFADIAVAVGL